MKEETELFEQEKQVEQMHWARKDVYKRQLKVQAKVKIRIAGTMALKPSVRLSINIPGVRIFLGM